MELFKGAQKVVAGTHDSDFAVNWGTVSNRGQQPGSTIYLHLVLSNEYP
jgi:hypothetical protein